MTTFSLVHHLLRSRALKSITKQKKKKKISKHCQRVLVMEDSTKRKREMETKLLEKVSKVISAIKSAKQVYEKRKIFLVTHNQ